jgi:hypothetical protein
MDQKPVTIGEADELDIRLDGCCNLDHGRRGDQLHPKRWWHNLTCRRCDVLRVAAASQERDAGIIDRPVGNLLTNLGDRPRHLESDDRARARKELVTPLSLQQIATVDARRRDLDQHLIGARAGGLDLSEFEHVRRTGFPGNDGFHAPQRATGRRDAL